MLTLTRAFRLRHKNRPPFISRDAFLATRQGTASVAGDVPALHKEFILEDVKAVGEEKDHTLRMRITTSTRDRQNDTLAADGWKLANFRKNPVVLWAHDYDSPPIARDEAITVDEIGLLGSPRFTTREMNPFGDMIYQMLLGKFLNAASVGFNPLKYVLNEQEQGFDFVEQELIEYSIVPIPANPEALIDARAAGIDTAPLKGWAEQALEGIDGAGLWLPKGKIEGALRVLTPRKFVVPVSVKGDKEFLARLKEELGPAVTIEEAAPAPEPAAPAPAPAPAPEPVATAPEPDVPVFVLEFGEPVPGGDPELAFEFVEEPAATVPQDGEVLLEGINLEALGRSIEGVVTTVLDRRLTALTGRLPD